MKRFALWRWVALCLCGFRHRKGEHWFRVQKGKPPERVSRCTRCGVKGKGLAH